MLALDKDYIPIIIEEDIDINQYRYITRDDAEKYYKEAIINNRERFYSVFMQFIDNNPQFFIYIALHFKESPIWNYITNEHYTEILSRSLESEKKERANMIIDKNDDISIWHSKMHANEVFSTVKNKTFLILISILCIDFYTNYILPDMITRCMKKIYGDRFKRAKIIISEENLNDILKNNIVLNQNMLDYYLNYHLGSVKKLRNIILNLSFNNQILIKNIGMPFVNLDKVNIDSLSLNSYLKFIEVETNDNRKELLATVSGYNKRYLSNDEQLFLYKIIDNDNAITVQFLNDKWLLQYCNNIITNLTIDQSILQVETINKHYMQMHDMQTHVLTYAITNKLLNIVQLAKVINMKLDKIPNGEITLSRFRIYKNRNRFVNKNGFIPIKLVINIHSTSEIIISYDVRFLFNRNEVIDVNLSPNIIRYYNNSDTSNKEIDEYINSAKEIIVDKFQAQYDKIIDCLEQFEQDFNKIVTTYPKIYYNGNLDDFIIEIKYYYDCNDKFKSIEWADDSSCSISLETPMTNNIFRVSFP